MPFPSAGGFGSFGAGLIQGYEDSEHKRLADEENLLTIPGDMFGSGQERFIRLAFANVSDDKIPIVLERLERFGA